MVAILDIGSNLYWLVLS